jgi:putative ABC transport system permease protein
MKSITKGQVKAGLDAIKRTKIRNFWTMLGVIIGVASFILVVAISEGIKTQINGRINQIGSDLITVQPQVVHDNGASLDTLALLSGLSVSGSLSPTDVSTVAASKDVKQVAPLSDLSASVKGNGSSYSSGLVIGTTPNFASLLNQSMQNGIFLTGQDDQSNGVVLGDLAARDLFNEDVPLGLPLSINGQTYYVRGIFNPFPSTPLSSGSEFNKSIFVTYNNSLSLTNNTITTYEILAKPNDIKNTKTATKDIYNNLAKTHGGQANFSVLDQSQVLSNSNVVLNLVTKLITGVAAIALLVGGVGIMNVMFVSVSERMHEIGIRKAVGATNRQILQQFMVESTVLSTVGGILGIIVALIIDVVLRLITNLQPEISFPIVLFGLVVSLIIGIIFGTFPALKAARKDPIDALHTD